MANKKFLLGILVLALVFGMTVIGCEEEEESEPYSQSITIYVSLAPFMDPYTDGNGQIVFSSPGKEKADTTYTGTRAKISVAELEWLTVSDIKLELSNANDRTVSITSIEKRGDGDYWSSVDLKLTRSAPPPENDGVKDYGTATVSITLPDDFTAKYPDGITWKNKTFKF